MVKAIMEQLPKEPVKGVKKLLEIYAELLKQNNSKSGDVLQQKLSEWQDVKKGKK